jgi:hypothetical protein
MRLVVVKRSHPFVFRGLERLFEGKADVCLIWDRRSGDDRRQIVRVTAAGTRADRRQHPATSWLQNHYVVAKLEPARD